jgi:hypothetical protein
MNGPFKENSVLNIFDEFHRNIKHDRMQSLLKPHRAQVSQSVSDYDTF